MTSDRPAKRPRRNCVACLPTCCPLGDTSCSFDSTSSLEVALSVGVCAQRGNIYLIKLHAFELFAMRLSIVNKGEWFPSINYGLSKFKTDLKTA